MFNHTVQETKTPIPEAAIARLRAEKEALVKERRADGSSQGKEWASREENGASFAELERLNRWVQNVRDWRDANPDALPKRAWRSTAERAVLREYEELADQVTTAGEIWRGAITRGITFAATYESGGPH